MRGRKAAQLFLSVDSIHTSQKCFSLISAQFEGRDVRHPTGQSARHPATGFD